MKKLLFLFAFVLMVAGAYAQNNRTATDTTKPKTTAPAPAKTTATPAPASNIATEKEVAKAPDVVLAEGNFFTGEVLIIGTSKIFLTTQENIFVWLRDNKAVEIRMIKPSTYELQIKQKGYQVYDRWPMVLKVAKEDFLVYYFATSGGGYYGLPDGSIKKEPHMKQSGVVRSDWLGNKRGVEKFSSLRKLIEQYEKSSSPNTEEDELGFIKGDEFPPFFRLMVLFEKAEKISAFSFFIAIPTNRHKIQSSLDFACKIVKGPSN